MKKVISLIMILAVVMMMTIGSVYAASSFTVALQADKAEYEKDGTVIVTVNLKDMQVGNGINVFSADLDYDSNCFEDIKVNGINGWSGAIYNANTKQLLVDTNELMTKEGGVLQISFKAKASGTLTMKKVQAAGGEGDIEAAETKIDIKVSGNSQGGNQGGTNQGGSSNQGGDVSQITTIPTDNSNQGNSGSTVKPTNTPNNNTNKVKLPQAGEDNTILFLAAGAVVIVAALFVRIKIMDSKTK